MAAERIRVFIAGNIYVKRALVRRFLEDDGFEVVGEARNREDMVAATRREQPDAIVVDDELLVDGPGGGTMGRIRRAAPDAKVVVFTSNPVDPAAAPSDADGYLEKGLGLASLTALLGRLFAEPAVAPSDAALAETAALAAIAFADDPADGAVALVSDGSEDDALAGVGAASVAAATPGPPKRSGGASRLVAMVAGALLIVWGLGTMIASGGDDTPTRALDTTDQTDGTVVDETADGATPLDEAHATLDELIDALESGNYVLAAVDARALMQLRDDARGAGFALTGIDAEIVARLDPVVVTIPTRVATELGDILGGLFPTTETTPTEPTSPTDVVLDPVTTPSSGTTTGTTPSTPTDDGTNPTTDPAPAPTPQPAPPQPAPPQPGDGAAWGQSHNPHGGPPGQTGNHAGPTESQKRNHDGGKPPWAGGN